MKATSRRFPIQGGFTVSWEAAELAFREYSTLGTGQSLERLSERGGFSIAELLWLIDRRSSSISDYLTLTQHSEAVLHRADLRSTFGGAS